MWMGDACVTDVMSSYVGKEVLDSWNEFLCMHGFPPGYSGFLRQSKDVQSRLPINVNGSVNGCVLLC